MIYLDKQKQYLALLFLLFALAFGLRLYFAWIDDYLHSWDERFHALVAKNMISEPLMPMLRVDPLLAYDYQAWCCNHIWLHKQPLFLWQMALSMKLFGVNLVAMRLPSLLMSAALLFPSYRIAALLYSPAAGILAAAFVAFSGYHIQLATGFMGMEHNDTAFIFYVSLSIWAFVEYLHRGQKHLSWALLIGFFAAAAVLCKWLVGLLVFSAWGLLLLWQTWQSYKGQAVQQSIFRAWRDMILAFLLCLALFLPWQIYVAYSFPLESSYERAFNTRHFFEALEGHTGSWLFHLHWFGRHYSWPLLLPLAWGGWQSIRSKKNSYPYLLPFYIALIYIFFTLAASKLPSFCFIISPLVYTLIGLAFTSWIQSKSQALRLLALAFLGLCLYSNAQPWWLYQSHFEAEHIAEKRADANLYRQLDTLLGDEIDVLVNAKPFADVEVMFFSKYQSYCWTSEENYEKLKAQGLRIASFDYGDSPVPYIRSDSSLLLIDATGGRAE